MSDALTANRAADWRTHPWQRCTGCGAMRRISHRRLGTCVSCALPVLRAETEGVSA